MICILHGYLLEGSGSNLWTRSIIEALCRQGHDVHLMAQENHPELYPFISEARLYHRDGRVETVHVSSPGLAGTCVLHKPELEEPLPVYVRDRYEEFSEVAPMVELDTERIEEYIEINVRALREIVRTERIRVIHANHAVLMPEIARRIHEESGVPFAMMPHGSAIEYAVKPDERMWGYARAAAVAAARLIVVGEEMFRRTESVLAPIENLAEKTVQLRLGVDTGRFRPVDREQRPESIEQLRRSLRDLERGKSAESSEAVVEAGRGGSDVEDLLKTIESADEYELKEPDEDLEEKLSLVDWERDRTLLYVGRLIANKGPQNILAALPFVLRQEPGLRFVLVGHGPLRETLEALVGALSEGNESLVREIVAQGRRLEGETEGDDSFREWELFLDDLDRSGEAGRYFESAAKAIDPARVIFTGYLTHNELRYLFPCFDVAIFPSLVREAGPLVFLEAMASGIVPMGTYFGGMKASIDSLEGVIPAEDLDLMKIDPSPERLVRDLAMKLPRALRIGDRWRNQLRQAAVDHYDWQNVAAHLYDTLWSAARSDAESS